MLQKPTRFTCGKKGHFSKDCPTPKKCFSARKCGTFKSKAKTLYKVQRRKGRSQKVAKRVWGRCICDNDVIRVNSDYICRPTNKCGISEARNPLKLPAQILYFGDHSPKYRRAWEAFSGHPKTFTRSNGG